MTNLSYWTGSNQRSIGRRAGPGGVEQSVLQQERVIAALQLADGRGGVAKAKGEVIRDS